MGVKGQDGYDYALQGMGLGYATSNRGAATSTTPSPRTWKTRLAGKAKPCGPRIGPRRSIHRHLPLHRSAEELSNIDAAGEGDWSPERIVESGDTWNLERQFNLAAGLTAKDDSLPKRLLKCQRPRAPPRARSTN